MVIIDDSEPVRRVLREVASEAGFTVIAEAADGLSGVIAAVRLVPDVVVIDYYMPELDGVRATGAILQRRPEIDVVAFSSADEAAVAGEFAAAGASAYVPKSDVDGLVLELTRRARASGDE